MHMVHHAPSVAYARWFGVETTLWFGIQTTLWFGVQTTLLRTIFQSKNYSSLLRVRHINLSVLPFSLPVFLLYHFH